MGLVIFNKGWQNTAKVRLKVRRAKQNFCQILPVRGIQRVRCLNVPNWCIAVCTILCITNFCEAFPPDASKSAERRFVNVQRNVHVPMSYSFCSFETRLQTLLAVVVLFRRCLLDSGKMIRLTSLSISSTQWLNALRPCERAPAQFPIPLSIWSLLIGRCHNAQMRSTVNPHLEPLHWENVQGRCRCCSSLSQEKELTEAFHLRSNVSLLQMWAIFVRFRNLL